jgi:putative endonuclease
MLVSVYILKLSDGTHYTGITKDLKRRMFEHKSKRCPYTATRLPFEIIFSKSFESYKLARYIEKQIKHRGAGKWLGTHLLKEKHRNILSVL